MYGDLQGEKGCCNTVYVQLEFSSVNINLRARSTVPFPKFSVFSILVRSSFRDLLLFVSRRVHFPNEMLQTNECVRNPT